MMMNIIKKMAMSTFAVGMTVFALTGCGVTISTDGVSWQEETAYVQEAKDNESQEECSRETSDTNDSVASAPVVNVTVDEHEENYYEDADDNESYYSEEVDYDYDCYDGDEGLDPYVIGDIYGEDFIFPWSSDLEIDREEIECLSKDEVRIAINEIYAKHGHIFESEDLNERFYACEWYCPVKNVTDEDFNSTELTNISLLAEYR